MQSDFSIVYQDDELVAIHKPAGILVHRSTMDRHETLFALQMTRDATGKKVFPVHRLDKPTSGLMLFAFSSRVSRQMQEQFQNGKIRKIYMALVRGWPQERDWKINKPLKYQVDKYSEKDVSENKIQAAETGFRHLAKTTINHPVGRFDSARYSLVSAIPATGRKHQIRRHLNHCSYPIIGDTNHGDRHHNHFFQDYFGQQRLYLAATRLEFLHPVTGRAMDLSADLQDNFQRTLDSLEWQTV